MRQLGDNRAGQPTMIDYYKTSQATTVQDRNDYNAQQIAHLGKQDSRQIELIAQIITYHISTQELLLVLMFLFANKENFRFIY